VIWDLDQIPARGIEQVKEWYAEFPVKASACVRCGVCVERCPFDVEIAAKTRVYTLLDVSRLVAFLTIGIGADSSRVLPLCCISEKRK
jgi:ferredoxin